MKLYRHYKNMPYKLLGIARHSETQEELALYETRYENAGGKIWVRPKEMFFEDVEIQGKKIPRFEKVNCEILSKSEISEEDLRKISILMEKGFGEWDPKWFSSRLASGRKLHLMFAMVDGQAVAFKLGYELDQTKFYSWLGAVLPEYRGLGLGRDLMTAQHDWCRSEGYTSVQTKTQNRFREMLLLNIAFGFEIIGTHLSHEGGIKIILEKKLI